MLGELDVRSLLYVACLIKDTPLQERVEDQERVDLAVKDAVQCRRLNEEYFKTRLAANPGGKHYEKVLRDMKAELNEHECAFIMRSMIRLANYIPNAKPGDPILCLYQSHKSGNPIDLDHL
ncbi:MAG: hypothetical protein ACE5FT_07115 [Candidatus Nanoarchaeia archaeon]